MHFTKGYSMIVKLRLYFYLQKVILFITTVHKSLTKT